MPVNEASSGKEASDKKIELEVPRPTHADLLPSDKESSEKEETCSSNLEEMAKFLIKGAEEDVDRHELAKESLAKVPFDIQCALIMRNMSTFNQRGVIFMIESSVPRYIKLIAIAMFKNIVSSRDIT